MYRFFNPSKENKKILVFDGDSLTEGTNASGIDQYYPKEVNKITGGKFYSFGVSGQKTREMLGKFNSQIKPLPKYNSENFIIAWEEANAILHIEGRVNSEKVTAQENFDDMIHYFDKSRNAGYQHRILITGYYPRLDQNNEYRIGEYVITHQSVDEMELYFNMVANADLSSVTWTHHIDLRNASNIGGSKGQLINETYFADYIHLKSAGYNEVADMVINEINKISNL
jgi:hypothetical protein